MFGYSPAPKWHILTELGIEGYTMFYWLFGIYYMNYPTGATLAPLRDFFYSAKSKMDTILIKSVNISTIQLDKCY